MLFKPVLQQSGYIFGVNCTGPPPTAYLFQGQTEELQPTLIDMTDTETMTFRGSEKAYFAHRRISSFGNREVCH
jgi:hypothetical protein